jgi:hypothetical protein
MGRFGQELIESMRQAVEHAAAEKVREIRLPKPGNDPLPDDTAEMDDGSVGRIEPKA